MTVMVETPVCFYCDALLARNDCEYDHFPTPREAGGEIAVPSCKACHGMKDRFPLDKWPVEWMVKVTADFPRVSRETRIFLAKMMRLFAVKTK